MSIIVNFFQIITSILFLSYTYSILRCDDIDYSLSNKFYRMKSCYRQNTSIIARSKLSTFSRCLNYVLQKRGLAFNFSPVKKQDDDDDDDFLFMNCEVLGCPNLDNLTSLINDSRFDYYSIYGNTEALMNAFCVSTIGVFNLHFPGENYTLAQNACAAEDGSLPHIVDEARTSGLGQLLAGRKPDWKEATELLPWNTIAYVGLNDRIREGFFVTEKGEPIDCFRYRAWAPGHPRSRRKKDDCVIIDDLKTWLVVNCAKKLPFFCELQPRPPLWAEYKQFENSSCTDFTNRTLKRKCKKLKKKFKKAIKSIDYKKEMKNKYRCEDY